MNALPATIARRWAASLPACPSTRHPPGCPPPTLHHPPPPPTTPHHPPPPPQVFNLGSPGAVYKSLQSPLKYQTRCISCFPDKTGYLLGSIEGRVAVHHVEESMNGKNFTFKCHR